MSQYRASAQAVVCNGDCGQAIDPARRVPLQFTCTALHCFHPPVGFVAGACRMQFMMPTFVVFGLFATGPGLLR